MDPGTKTARLLAAYHKAPTTRPGLRSGTTKRRTVAGRLGQDHEWSRGLRLKIRNLDHRATFGSSPM